METIAADQGVGNNLITESDVTSDITELFRHPPQETSLLSGRTLTFRRLNENNEGPYVFNIHPHGMQYLQLSTARLFIEGNIVHSDGTALAVDEKGDVALTNLPGCAIFSSIDISIDGTPYPELSNKFANYKGYLETVLTYSPEAATSHLAAAHFRMDTPKLFNTFEATNEVHVKRSAFCDTSRMLQISTPLPSDFFQVDRLFPPGTRITLTLNRAEDRFFICSSKNDKSYKFQIRDMYLNIRHVTLSPEIVQQHQKDVESGKPILLPYNRTTITTFSYAAGTPSIRPILLEGPLPKFLMLGFVKSANFHGSFKTNPFEFVNCDINNLSINVNGETIPSIPYTPDFDNDLVTREYREFFDNIGILTGNKANMMTPHLFLNGLTLFPFDLTPDQCGGYHIHERKTGSISLYAEFKKALPQGMNLVVAASYDAQLIIGRDKMEKRTITTEIMQELKRNKKRKLE